MIFLQQWIVQIPEEREERGERRSRGQQAEHDQNEEDDSEDDDELYNTLRQRNIEKDTCDGYHGCLK